MKNEFLYFEENAFFKICIEPCSQLQKFPVEQVLSVSMKLPINFKVCFIIDNVKIYKYLDLVEFIFLYAQN